MTLFFFLQPLVCKKKRRAPPEKNLTVYCGGRTALNFTDWTLKMCSALRTKPLRNCGVFCYVLSMSKHNYSKATHSCATVWISNVLNVMILLLVNVAVQKSELLRQDGKVGTTPQGGCFFLQQTGPN
jgi:hypothetical protein